MTVRGGYALAIVLAALVIMSMTVAVSAQRALTASRLATLALARSELAAAALSGQARALEALDDSAGGPVIVPGGVLATGVAASGHARARWTVIGAAAPFAGLDVATEVPLVAGLARAQHRALAAWQTDSIRGARWTLAGGSGWVRVPSR